MKNSIQQYC